MQRKKKEIGLLEILLISSSFIFIPFIILVNLFLKNKQSFLNVNFVNATAVSMGFIFLVFIIIQLVTRRSYLTKIFSCHCNEERSFKLSHKYFGICSRCFGILIGILMTSLITIFNFNYLWLLLGMPFLIIDGLVQLKSSYESTNIKRLITGILFGPSLVILFAYYNYFIIKILFIIFK